SAAELQALDPSVDTEFSARGANNDAIPYYERRHGSGLTVANIGDLSLPDFVPGACVDRHGVAIQQVVDDLPVGVEGAAINRLAAGDPDCIRTDLGPILPLEGIPLTSQVECVQHVRPGGHHVHGVADHQRLTLVTAENTSGESPYRMHCPGILCSDLREGAVARRRIVLGRHGPLSVLGDRLPGSRCALAATECCYKPCERRNVSYTQHASSLVIDQ